MEAEKLEEPLHFKTTYTRIVVGQDVKDYSKVPADWYRNNDGQVHVTEANWKYVDVMTKKWQGETKIKWGLNWGRKRSRNIAIWWMNFVTLVLGHTMS